MAVGPVYQASTTKPRGGHAVAPASPAAPTGNPAPGSAGWKSFTAKRWATNHPYAGQDGVDPKTGQPVMKSIHEIRAEANADTWKSIAAMQAALPSTDSISAPYDAQRAAIAPLVEAHRAWLEQAGKYQTDQATKLGAAAGATVSGADAVQAGQAGGAGLGAGFAGNVSPGAIAAPEAYGSNFGSFLSSLLPSATAQGIGNIGTVNTAEDAALADLNSKRAAIAGQYPQLQQDAFKSSYDLAFNNYKSELAALADGSKTSLAQAKLKETASYHTGLLGLSEDRNTIAQNRANAALTKLGQPTAGDASGLRDALKQADLIMHPKATAGKTTKVPTRYGVTLTIPSAGKDPSTGLTVPGQRHEIAAGTPQEVHRQLESFMAANPHAGWQPAAGSSGHVAPIAGYTKDVPASSSTTGGANSYALRQRAWGKLVALNAASLHPVDPATLKNYFRAMEGTP